MGGHIPALDGLRGMAVLLVLVGHSRIPGLPEAAAAGVAVFFVLSGYLITRLLLRELAATGRVDLRRFYARRARRLFPALALMLAGVGLLWAVLDRPQDISRDTVAAALYAGNWYRIATETFGPLQHTWSLAVEEHFYAVWPLALIWLARRRLLSSGQLSVVFAATAAALIAWRITLALSGHAEWAYFGDDTNAAGLLLGASVAAREAQGRALPAAPIVGTVLLVASCLGWVTGEDRLGASVVAAPLAVVASAMLVTSRPGWLTFAPLRRLGVISYSVYLWHFPLVYLAVGLPFPGRGLVTSVLAIGVAAVSWVLVERPILNGLRLGDPEPVAEHPRVREHVRPVVVDAQPDLRGL